ncbi:MAG: terminase family protein, partial [Thermodesulfobacteriota bacterium]
MAKKQKTEVVSTGYTPRELQEKLHKELRRFNVLVMHRRFGKTVFAINEMIDQGLRCTLKNPQFAYIAPTYKQAKMVAWEYLIDFTRAIPGMEINKSELSVTIPRPTRNDKIKYMLLGAESPDALRGIYLDGAILDEYAQCDPIIWGQIIRPALSDRKGWSIFIGTPKGMNHFHKIFLVAQGLDNWYTKMYKASETGVVDAEELVDARATMSEEEYNQEYECDFTAAIMGSYYGNLLNELRDH